MSLPVKQAKHTSRQVYFGVVVRPCQMYSLGNHKNYHKPKFQLLFLHFLFIETQNKINKGGSFEDQICL